MLQTLAQHSTSGGLPRDIVRSTRRATGTLSENQTTSLLFWSVISWTHHHVLSLLWLDILKEPDKDSRQAFPQMEFSMSKTKYPSLLFQITEQMVKDLSNLHVGRRLDLNYDTIHYGIAPVSIMPLIADVRREREQEEREMVMATNTTVVNHRKSKKHALALDLTFKSVSTFLKCWRFFNLSCLTENSQQTKSEVSLEATFIEKHAMIGWVEPGGGLS